MTIAVINFYQCKTMMSTEKDALDDIVEIKRTDVFSLQ